MEYQINGINFLGMGNLMLEIEKCCEGVFTPPTREISGNQFRSFDIPSIKTQSVMSNELNFEPS